MKSTGYYVEKLETLQDDLINDQAELDTPNQNKTELYTACQLHKTEKAINQAIDWITDGQ